MMKWKLVYISKYSFLYVLLVIIFTIISLVGIPFRYDQLSNGRYVLRVIKAADPELFPNDSVVESLNRFAGLFYIFLAKIYEITKASPQSVEQTIYILYVIAKFLLIIAILCVTRSLSHKVILFILLAAWVSYRQDGLLGGEALFENELNHSTFSEIFGLIALCFLFRQYYFYFWLLLSFSILIHPLVSAHLALCIIPVIFFINRNFQKENIIGLILLLFTSFLYFFLLSPPSFSGEEAQIFLNAKGTISHISPFNQNSIGWIRLILLMILTLLGLKIIDKLTLNEKLIIWFIICGSLISITLSLIAISTKWVRLAQFQPMRIFSWVTFFIYLLLAIITVKTWYKKLMTSIILVAVFALEILRSLWALPFALIGIIDLLVRNYTKKRGYDVSFWDNLVIVGIISIVVVMFLLWKVSKLFSFPITTFLNPLPLGVGIMLVGLVFLRQGEYLKRTAILVAIIVYALLGGAIHWHLYYDTRDHPEWDASIYKARTHPDWDAVRRWCRDHTPKDARFIVAGGYGNFRALAWRTVIGEPMGALAWVDPLEYARNEKQLQKVLSTYEDGFWNLNKLFDLAKQWNVSYIIVNGPYKPFIQPIFQTGSFSVFRVFVNEIK